MTKAKAHPGQLGFAFEPPAPASAPAQLAGLERQVSGVVGSILASDPRSRSVIAAEMSDLLGDRVSKEMLDAYASPARDEHKVPMSRLLALVAVTKRHDLLDPLMRQIGAALLVDEEVRTARLGHIEVQIQRLSTERQQLLGSAPLIRGDS
jgi:hypothetical protein